MKFFQNFLTSGVMEDEDYVFTSIIAIALAVSFDYNEIGMALFAVLMVWTFLFKPPFSTKRFRLPPKAPFGLVETITKITTDDVTWFFLRVHDRVKSNVCRINFPLPGCPYTCSISDVDLAREILTDKTTVKAESLVKPFERVTAGVSQFFTSNGHRFHHARKAIAPAFSNKHIVRMNEVTIAKPKNGPSTD